MDSASQVLLTVSRAQLLSKALLAARRLARTVASLAMHVKAGGKAPSHVYHAAADAHALADQLASLLGTKRAHVHPAGQGSMPPPPGVVLGAEAASGGGSGGAPRPRG